MDDEVSIGRVKRDISELVNRVAYGGERIILTSRGRPKAALVSLGDYEHLKHESDIRRKQEWETWRAASNRLAEEILARRSGEPVDVEHLLDESRRELEERHDHIRSR